MIELKFDKKYTFTGHGTAKIGRYQKRIGKDSNDEIYHLFIVDEGSRFYPILVRESQILSSEEKELYELLSDPKQYLFYDKVLAWHYKWKTK